MQGALAELQELTDRHLAQAAPPVPRPTTASAPVPATRQAGKSDARNDMARNVMRKLYKRNVELEKSVHLLEVRVPLRLVHRSPEMELQKDNCLLSLIDSP